AWITTLGVCAFLTYLAMDQFGLLASPYAGLFGFMGAPAVCGRGLTPTPMGLWLEARRRRAGHAAWQWPAIDLGASRTRAIVTAVVLLTIVNLTLVTAASVGAIHYSESNTFCGQVCHVPMEPEFTAHKL